MRYSALLLILGLSACSGNPGPQTEVESMSQEQMREALIERNRTVLTQQRNRILQYIKDEKLEMERSGTGMYFQFLIGGPAVQAVQDEDEVSVRYQLSLLNGNPIYTSSQTEHFVVGKDDSVLLGVQEAVKLMKEGDSLFAILPSHLAYGVGGDLNQVPTEAVIALHLKLLSIN